MGPARKNHHETVLRMLPLVFALTLACDLLRGFEVSTPDDSFLLEAMEDLEAAENATGTFIAEVENFPTASMQTATAAAVHWATETAMVAATRTADARPPNTSTPEEKKVSQVFIDTQDDCQFSDGPPTDCLGIDIDRVVMGLIRNDGDLIMFNQEAEETGIVLPDTPISVPYPFIIGGIIIRDFDPDASFICFNWADQQTATAPTDPIANVLATCFNPRFEFLYVNDINTSGQQGVEADPEGTLVYIDPTIGITFVQELDRVYRQDPLPSFTLLVVLNDEPQFDAFRFVPDGF